jgi:trans-2,3-dihydro-3-hydroxyanthranilate isomerase
VHWPRRNLAPMPLRGTCRWSVLPAYICMLRTNRDGADIQSRMFAPLYGVPEDPATGSANVALIGLLAQLCSEPDLHLEKTIGQGIEMGWPSRLIASAHKSAGTVTRPTLAAHACR